MDFTDFYFSAVPKHRQFKGTLLALDPGETTGYAVFEVDVLTDIPKMLKYGELTCNPFKQGIDKLTAIIANTGPDFIVLEDYRVYSWKTKDHSWSQLHTPRLIGTIETLCHQQKIPFRKQMAQHAKGFCTNEKLKDWDFYVKGKVHARDAIRHGLYYMLFNVGKK